MDNDKFKELSEFAVRNWVEDHLDKSEPIPKFKVYTVWSTKVLQNNKAMIATSLPDGRYFEATSNGDKLEMYLDVYTKIDNQCVALNKED